MKTILLILVTLTLLLIPQASLGQEKTVTGTVTDESDLPLPGVNVLVKGTTSGTQTDFDGNYSIGATEDQTLVFSYLGQKTTEMVVGTSSTINVQLEEDASQLDEVIVVGYGTQCKRNVTDNIATISSDQLNEIPTPSLQSALTAQRRRGKITQINGKVEGGIKVRVRGDDHIVVTRTLICG